MCLNSWIGLVFRFLSFISFSCLFLTSAISFSLSTNISSSTFNVLLIALDTFHCWCIMLVARDHMSKTQNTSDILQNQYLLMDTVSTNVPVLTCMLHSLPDFLQWETPHLHCTFIFVGLVIFTTLNIILTFLCNTYFDHNLVSAHQPLYLEGLRIQNNYYLQ